MARRLLRRFSIGAGVHRNVGIADVVISGGGIVGSALACALGKSSAMRDKRLVLLEASSENASLPQPGDRYGNRVSALTPATIQFLKDVDAWETICSTRMKSFRTMHVWDSCSEARIEFDSKSVSDLPYMGCIVENRVILGALRRCLRNVETVENCQVNLVEKSPREVQLSSTGNEQLKARLLIGADGANSTVRKAIEGGKHYSKSYHQTAVVATLHFAEEIENETAWQRFLPTGPIALLPLSDTSSSLVWSTSPSHAQSLLQLPEDSFVDSVNSAFSDNVRNQSLPSRAVQALRSLNQSDHESVCKYPPSILRVDEGSRASFPLALYHGSTYVNDRIALVGDAAHRIHPMAGQGLNLGFGDAIALAKVIAEAAENGEDLGSEFYLRRYERERLRRVVPVMASIDALNTLFSTSNSALALVRGVGLQFTDMIAPLKTLIIKTAAS
ncbi:ubiquinone biosynthesis monooxygenase COQ6, mitochondrial-like [Oscarella lobularis]|uniref:ubiquinone biosynthesis monooxygenase COQ6, mitochondrial-like n=1 Tax=Oscarella lobularis TaxID=121494 RepID=UPI0033132496